MTDTEDEADTEENEIFDEELQDSTNEYADPEQSENEANEYADEDAGDLVEESDEDAGDLVEESDEGQSKDDEDDGSIVIYVDADGNVN